MLKTPRGGMWAGPGRWMIRRERRVYRELEGLPGVPRCFGLTEEGLLLEASPGRALSEFRRGDISVGFLDCLDSLIAGIHARGVAHSDLKKRANILVREKGREGEREKGNPGEEQSPVIVDFGAAFLKGELLYETFRRVDLAAAAKLRAHHQPETLRTEQKYILDHPTWAERLSRFLVRAVRDPFRAIWKLENL
ncbi:hypothetical protein HY522_07825 [bacterium]|nr:hypothetical protein [bacterium]